MEIKIEDIGLLELYGTRFLKTGKLKFADQFMPDWPNELTISEIPGMELELVETEEDGMIVASQTIVESKAYYRVK